MIISFFQFTTTPYLSVFELLYENILSKLEDSTKIGTWTFAIYIMMWNFISKFFFFLTIVALLNSVLTKHY